MKEVEITDFELFTTGIISIAWKDKDGDKFINVDLDLASMLLMLKKEGLTYDDVQRISESEKPIVFHKVTLLLYQDEDKEGQYYTSECFDNEDDPTVFHVEVKE